MPKLKAAEAKEEKTFTKAQLVRADRYKDRQDLLNALLVDTKRYTLTEVDTKIEAFMKGGHK